jgi:hypothetical protein
MYFFNNKKTVLTLQKKILYKFKPHPFFPQTTFYHLLLNSLSTAKISAVNPDPDSLG